MTVRELIDLVLGLAYPKRFVGSLLQLKEHYIIQGLTELQRRVEGFRAANMTITPGTMEAMVSGATILPAPLGFIEQVAVGTDGCMTIFCDHEPHQMTQQRQADWAESYDCGVDGIVPVYPQARVLWSRDGPDLMIYPWVPAPWHIGVRWNGIKRDWQESEEVWWAQAATEAMRLYVLYRSSIDDNCEPNRIGILQSEFVTEAAKLKTEDFQIRNPAPGPSYMTEVMSRPLMPCHQHPTTA